MTSIFTTERQALSQRIDHNRTVVYSLAGTALACLLAPILFDGMLPRPLKTGLLGTATAGLLGAAIISQQTQVGEDMMQSLRTADKEHLKRHFAHKAAVAEQEQMIASRADLLKRILYSQQPIRWQWEAAKQCGIENDWKAVALEWGWVPYNVLYPPQQQQRSPSTHQAAMVPQRQHEALPVDYQEQPILSLELFDRYPSILVFGAQGSGKTTFARAIAARRHQQGHTIKVLDPHGDPSEWPYPLVGSGMKYQAISREMYNFHAEVEHRYERYAKGQRDFEPLTLICDEFTNWASRTEGASEFFYSAMSDIRKVNLGVIFISHARTLKGLGNAQGLAATRDAGLLELELIAEVNRSTGQASPTGQGKLKLPGQDFEAIAVPDVRSWVSQTEIIIRQQSTGLDDWRSQLEQTFTLDAHPDFEPEPEPIEQDYDREEDLPEPLLKLLEFSRGRDWIKPRDVQSGCKPLRGFSTVQILEFFKQLADLELGELQGADPKLEFRSWGGNQPK